MASHTAFVLTRSGLRATAATHVLITTASLLHGTFGATLPPDDSEGWEQDKNSRLFVWLPQLDLLVWEAYAGHGVGSRYLPKTAADSSAFVKLGKDVTFEDPAAICAGPDEISEAFRALKVVRPEFVAHPRRMKIEQTGAPEKMQCTITYYLHQRYGGFLTVRSLLRVEVATGAGSKADKEVSSGTSVRVVRIEERWNGVEPLNWGPFHYSRRLNGILSWWLTTLIV